MNKRVSFEEIGAVTATFWTGDGVRAGEVVGLAQAETVGRCGAGERFCGIALSVSADGAAAVQVGGFAQVPVSGGLTLGWVSLTADGAGGVKRAAEGDKAGDYLVVDMDETDKTAVVLL